MNSVLDLSSEVDAALRAGSAIVALESTIIAHGMPYPQNVETALAVEADVRALGATPATVAILDGRLKAGLGHDEIERIGRGGRDIAKASRRDMPILVARGGTGATTVAATMIVAALANIPVFATGGIGGVHRGAATSFDISADLQALANSSVAVVCAGAKAVLDLRLTLEYLETHGVPVIGYGTDRLPAFWSRDSGLGVDVRFDTPDEIARLMKAKWQMGLTGGLVIANPIPEAFELPRDASTARSSKRWTRRARRASRGRH
jgi:pseudouridylate synthase